MKRAASTGTCTLTRATMELPIHHPIVLVLFFIRVRKPGLVLSHRTVSDKTKRFPRPHPLFNVAPAPSSMLGGIRPSPTLNWGWGGWLLSKFENPVEFCRHLYRWGRDFCAIQKNQRQEKIRPKPNKKNVNQNLSKNEIRPKR